MTHRKYYIDMSETVRELFDKYLLDASALLPLITERGKKLTVEASRGNLVTTGLDISLGENSLSVNHLFIS